MKNKQSKNIFSVVVFMAMLLLIFFSVVSSSYADDYEYDDDFYEHERTTEDRDEYQESEELNIVEKVVNDFFKEEDADKDEPKIIAPVVTPVTKSNPVPVVNTVYVSSNNYKEIERLTDSDFDGITNENDKHPGEDDFAYSVVDTNSNGIADDLELVLK